MPPARPPRRPSRRESDGSLFQCLWDLFAVNDYHRYWMERLKDIGGHLLIPQFRERGFDFKYILALLDPDSTWSPAKRLLHAHHMRVIVLSFLANVVVLGFLGCYADLLLRSLLRSDHCERLQHLEFESAVWGMVFSLSIPYHFLQRVHHAPRNRLVFGHVLLWRDPL